MNTKVRSLVLSVVATAAFLGVCHYRAHHGPMLGTFGPSPMLHCMEGDISTDCPAGTTSPPVDDFHPEAKLATAMGASRFI